MRAGIQDFLQAFSLDALQAQLTSYSSMASMVIDQGTSTQTCSSILEKFISHYQTNSTCSPEFVYEFHHIWSALDNQGSALEFASLQVALERRLYMVANAIAWRWLTKDCVAHVQQLAMQLQQNVQALRSSTDWFARIVRDIYQAYRANRSVSLIARNYLPDLSDPDQVWNVRRTSHATTEGLTALLCSEVVDLLARWLHFPTNTRRLCAAFTTSLVDATGNMDVLLLAGVWRAHQTIITTILDCKGRRQERLRTEMLNPFILTDRKSTRLNSSHSGESRMPSSA